MGRASPAAGWAVRPLCKPASEISDNAWAKARPTLHGGAMEPVQHATYVGDDLNLKGEKALIRESGTSGYVLAQFDNRELTFAFGWHSFKVSDFAVDIELVNP